MTKIAGYIVGNAGETVSVATNHVVNGQLTFAVTGDTGKGWEDISIRKISNIKQIAAVANDAAEERRATLSSTVAVGETFTATISVADSRQKLNKVFKYVAVAGDTPTTVANALVAAINASEVAFTAASGAAGRLDVTNDTTAQKFTLTVGTDSAAASWGAVSVATAAAERTDGAFWAAQYGNVDAADLPDVAGYGALIIEYIDAEESSPKGKAIKKYAAYFYNVALGGIITDVNGADLASPVLA